MKKNIVMTLSFCLLTLGLSACNKNANDDMLTKMIDGLAKGVRIEGKIDETANFLTGYHGQVTGEMATTRFDVDYVFENRDLNGFERKVYAYEADGTRYSLVNDVLIEGQDGLAYYNELGYENKIVDVPATNGNGLDVNFGYFCDNPFRYLSKNDFTKINKNTYQLERKKASFIASKLFSSVDSIFDEVIKVATFTFENETLTNIEFQPVQIETYDTFGIDNRYFLLDARVQLQVSKIGTASVYRQSVRPHYESHTPLNNAFKEIQDNYTLNIAYDFKLDNVSQETVYYQFNYTEDGLFWKCDQGSQPTEADLLIRYDDNDLTTPYSYDAATEKFTTEAAVVNGYQALFNANKDLYVPIVSDVAAEVFDYSANQDAYHINVALQSFIGIECFIPACVAIDYLNGYGTDCVVTLDEEQHLDTIEISYYRRDSFSDESGTFTLSYSNVGTTTLPYDFN